MDKDRPIVVVSGFSPAGYKEYGARFLETFDRFWPPSIDLTVFVEEPLSFEPSWWPKKKKVQYREIFYPHLSDAQGCAEFIERHRNDPAACGRDPKQWHKERDRAKGYNFRFDTVKFCRMAMFAAQAARWVKDQENSILIWLDADVITHREVPLDLIYSLVGDANVAWLGREPKHPDAAFVAFQGIRGMAFAANLWGLTYEDDSVFKRTEWHSAFVLREIVMGLNELASFKLKDITPGGRGHVFTQSPLAPYMDHLKGEKRKARGFSLKARH